MPRPIRDESLINRIFKNGVAIGMVETPRGNISIHGLSESRCGVVKEYRYVTLPGNQSTFYSLTKKFTDHWKENKWNVRFF